MKEKESAARRARRKRDEEQQLGLPVWQRKKMENTTQSFSSTQELSAEGAQATQSSFGEKGHTVHSSSKSLASEAKDEDGSPDHAKSKRRKHKKQQSMKERVAAKKAEAAATQQEERMKSKGERSVMVVVERVLVQGDSAAGTIPKVYLRVEGGNQKGAHSSKLTVSCSHSFSQSNGVPYMWGHRCRSCVSADGPRNDDVRDARQNNGDGQPRRRCARARGASHDSWLHPSVHQPVEAAQRDSDQLACVVRRSRWECCCTRVASAGRCRDTR
eukprot:COSAG03_NODE_953_length_5213_cov_30.480055_7_plen_272_part_00